MKYPFLMLILYNIFFCIKLKNDYFVKDYNDMNDLSLK